MKANIDKKIDFSKTLKELYSATRKINEVSPGRGVFLSVLAKGAPGGPEFQSAIQKLYTLAYTLKFGVAKPKGLDFKVCSLECLYHIQDPCATPKEEWTWELLIRIPEGLSQGDLEQHHGGEAGARVGELAVLRVTGPDAPDDEDRE